MKKILRILILILIMWGFPTFALFYINPGLGALTSYLTILLLLVYFVFFVKEYRKPLLPFIFLGISYYAISGLKFLPELFVEEYLVYFIKFLIVVVCCTELAKDSKIEEIFTVTIFGALSIVIHGAFFPDIDAHFGANYGRFSGFYLNPNYAAITCLVGFSISYGVKNIPLRLVGQLVFTFAGILTLSRYFVLIWLLTNLVAVFMNRKNLTAPIIGAIVLSFVLISGAIKLQPSRFAALQSIFSDEEVKTETINDDSRTDTWAQFTDIIMDQPFFGNGFRNLQGFGFDLDTGVHNLYLLVIGEAGIIAFAFLMYIVLFLLIKSLQHYHHNFYYIFLTITLATSFLVGHTYFEKYSTIFISIFLYLKLLDHDNEKKELSE
ncbi:O-antigen ligase family protein [Algibacter luteus]|uniref:O-antigen ligase family protein n=1 Tax=Algibacter luteus TaxID=1178825 RepID=UPI00259996FE|nr:O-antigen ligase family protein [Algibacter luteus]WJJ95490.1 O-antigen ligase family protein [Algibacter luteus]